MQEEKYTWWTFIKKIGEFIAFLFSFFSGKRQKQAEEDKQRLKQSLESLSKKFEEEDKKKEEKKNEDLDKRLNNMF